MEIIDKRQKQKIDLAPGSIIEDKSGKWLLMSIENCAGEEHNMSQPLEQRLHRLQSEYIELQLK